MPEGDTLYRTAATLRQALLGDTLTGFESPLEAVAAVAARHGVAGRTVSQVEARGKHLLITLAPGGATDDGGPTTGDGRPATDGTVVSGQWPVVSEASGGGQPGTEDRGRTTDGGRRESGNWEASALTHTPTHPHTQTTDLVLHTHLRMTGSWHIYRPGEAWQKPAHRAVVTLRTERFVAPCFSAPVVELLTAWQVERHPDLRALGPDAITTEFDAEEALRRLQRRPDVEIGVALLDQRAMAGVGNVFKSEVLFLRRVNPFRKVGELPAETLAGLVEESHRLLLLNRKEGDRRTRFGLDERGRVWVYGRSGEPCRVCGSLVRMRRQGLDARSTYYCPKCQDAA